ncbi:MAG: SHOCT domain-containing protein [Thermodesulfobacteriota bacterium]
MFFCNNSESQSSQSDQVTSVAGEIRKFKALLDEGILTEDEFNAKKQQLLGI